MVKLSVLIVSILSNQGSCSKPVKQNLNNVKNVSIFEQVSILSNQGSCSKRSGDEEYDTPELHTFGEIVSILSNQGSCSKLFYAIFII